MFAENARFSQATRSIVVIESLHRSSANNRVIELNAMSSLSIAVRAPIWGPTICETSAFFARVHSTTEWTRCLLGLLQ
jgi:hypothetical protein